MWPNPQFPMESVTFTEKILAGKLHFCAVLFSVNDIYISFQHIILPKNDFSSKCAQIRRKLRPNPQKLYFCAVNTPA